jgi:hypothetical protein
MDHYTLFEAGRHTNKYFSNRRPDFVLEWSPQEMHFCLGVWRFGRFFRYEFVCMEEDIYHKLYHAERVLDQRLHEHYYNIFRIH